VTALPCSGLLGETGIAKDVISGLACALTTK